MQCAPLPCSALHAPGVAENENDDDEEEGEGGRMDMGRGEGGGRRGGEEGR